MGEGVQTGAELSARGNFQAVPINPRSTVILRIYTRLEKILLRANLPCQKFHRYGSGEPRLLLRGAQDPNEESDIDISVIRALTRGFPEDNIYVLCDAPHLARQDLLEIGREPRIYLYKSGLGEQAGLKGYNDDRRQYLTSVMLSKRIHEPGLVYFITREKDVKSASPLVINLGIPGYSFVTLYNSDIFDGQLLPRKGFRSFKSLVLERKPIAEEND